MTTVHVLLEGTDYEGYELLGVYATRDEALVAARAYVGAHRNSMGDWLQIDERELGAQRDWDLPDTTVFKRGSAYRGTKDEWLA